MSEWRHANRRHWWCRMAMKAVQRTGCTCARWNKSWEAPVHVRGPGSRSARRASVTQHQALDELTGKGSTSPAPCDQASVEAHGTRRRRYRQLCRPYHIHTPSALPPDARLPAHVLHLVDGAVADGLGGAALGRSSSGCRVRVLGASLNRHRFGCGRTLAGRRSCPVVTRQHRHARAPSAAVAKGHGSQLPVGATPG